MLSLRSPLTLVGGRAGRGPTEIAGADFGRPVFLFWEDEIMTQKELLYELRRLSLPPDVRHCFQCGREHSCSAHGCAIIQAAIEEIKRLSKGE